MSTLSDADELREQAKRFLGLAADYENLLQDIVCIPPVRPSEGFNIQLCQMLSLWNMVGITYDPLRDFMGGFIEITRAQIAKLFLERCTEKFLLMIDNDMVPPPDLPLLLARHDKPVVGSCAMAVIKPDGATLCFTRRDREGYYRFPSVVNCQVIPSKGLIEVGHVGTGAVMIRRDVLESFTWDKDDPDNEIPFLVDQETRVAGAIEGILKRGEDFAFCRQVRQKGFKVYVDLEAHVGHLKQINLLWPPEARSDNMDADTWFLEPKGKRSTENG